MDGNKGSFALRTSPSKMVFEKKTLVRCLVRNTRKKTEYGCQRATNVFEGLIDSTHGMVARFRARNALFKKKKKKKITTTNTQTGPN